MYTGRTCVIVEQFAPSISEGQEERASEYRDCQSHDDSGVRGDTRTFRLLLPEEVSDTIKERFTFVCQPQRKRIRTEQKLPH